MIVIPRQTTACDLAFGERGARSRWPYERVLQAAQDDAVTVTDQDLTVDGRAGEPGELRALASLVRSGLVELVPTDNPGAARVVLTEDGRAQLVRWARYTPLGGGEQS